MRKINTSDVFKLARIVRKANMKEEVKKIFSQITEAKKDDSKNIDDVQREVGMEMIAYLIEACGDELVEKDIYGLLAGISEKKESDIKNQSIDATIEMLKQIAKENDIQNFFSVAVKSA